MKYVLIQKINFLNFFFFFLIFFFFLNFIKEFNFKNKIYLFFLNLIFICSILLYYNLDGIVMLFFTIEINILFILSVVFFQCYFFFEKKKFNKIYYLLPIPFSFNYIKTSYSNYYSFFDINYNDFFFFYNFFFEKQLFISVLLVCIITLFSIFLILFYFILNNKSKQLTFIRKQKINKQKNYNTNIRTFK